MKGIKSGRECLGCGLWHDTVPGSITDRGRQPHCIKCDAPLFDLSDGSVRKIDIAHQRETVPQAIAKLRDTLEQAWQFNYVAQIRFIVGGGLIRDAVLAELHYLAETGTIVSFSEENRGAVLVRIRT